MGLELALRNRLLLRRPADSPRSRHRRNGRTQQPRAPLRRRPSRNAARARQRSSGSHRKRPSLRRRAAQNAPTLASKRNQQPRHRHSKSRRNALQNRRGNGARPNLRSHRHRHGRLFHQGIISPSRRRPPPRRPRPPHPLRRRPGRPSSKNRPTRSNPRSKFRQHQASPSHISLSSRVAGKLRRSNARSSLRRILRALRIHRRRNAIPAHARRSFRRRIPQRANIPKSPRTSHHRRPNRRKNPSLPDGSPLSRMEAFTRAPIARSQSC